MKALKHFLVPLFSVVAFCATTRMAQAAPCSPAHTFVTGETLTATVLNANPVAYSGCLSNIDDTNIGSAGIYASQIIPGNSSQATFGSTQNYSFPSNLSVPGNLSWGGVSLGGTLYGATGNINSSGVFGFTGSGTNSLSGPLSGTSASFTSTLGVTGATTTAGITDSSGISTSGNLVFGGSSLGGTLSGATGNIATSGVISLSGTGSNSLGGPLSVPGVTSTNAVQQTVSATNYVHPYDANSTAGSTNTHIEHGSLSATYGGGTPSFACASSHTFAKTFTSQPAIVGTLESGSSPGYIYINTESATAFTLCAESLVATTATIGMQWIAVGE